MKTTSKRTTRYRVQARILATDRDAVSATFKAFLDAWTGAPDPCATWGDTWSRLLTGRPFTWPPVPKATADNLVRLCKGVPGLAVQVERRT